MAMPPQLKTITISALGDAIIRLTQAKTRLTMTLQQVLTFPEGIEGSQCLAHRLGIVSPQCLQGISAAAEVP